MDKAMTLSIPGLVASLISVFALAIIILARKATLRRAQPDNPLMGGPFRKILYLAFLIVPILYDDPRVGAFFATSMLLHASRILVVLGCLVAMGEESYSRYLLHIYQGSWASLLLISAGHIISLCLGLALIFFSIHPSYVFMIGCGLVFTDLTYILSILVAKRRIRKRWQEIVDWMTQNLAQERA